MRDLWILPEMIGSVVGVYNGKVYTTVEIKVLCSRMNWWLLMTCQPEMLGHVLGEFSITYKPVRHGRPGIGATHSSRFIPLK